LGNPLGKQSNGISRKASDLVKPHSQALGALYWRPFFAELRSVSHAPSSSRIRTGVSARCAAGWLRPERPTLSAQAARASTDGHAADRAGSSTGSDSEPDREALTPFTAIAAPGRAQQGRVVSVSGLSGA